MENDRERLEHVTAEASALRIMVAALISAHPDRAGLREAMKQHAELGMRQIVSGAPHADLHHSLVKRKLETFFHLVAD